MKASRKRFACRWRKPSSFRRRKSSEIPSPGPQSRVLVVAADSDSRSILADQLKALGLTPLLVPDGLAALNAIDVWTPDVIVMTLDGPDAAVYQAVMRMAVANAASRTHIPLVAVVGQGGEHWRHSLDTQLDGALRHPPRIEELYATLARWLDLPLPPAKRRTNRSRLIGAAPA